MILTAAFRFDCCFMVVVIFFELKLSNSTVMWSSSNTASILQTLLW